MSVCCKEKKASTCNITWTSAEGPSQWFWSAAPFCNYRLGQEGSEGYNSS